MSHLCICIPTMINLDFIIKAGEIKKIVFYQH